MNPDPKIRRAPVLLLTTLAVLLLAGCIRLNGGPLENYVQKADPSYAWKKIDTTNTSGFTITHLELTSQTWHDHVWTHHLQVVRPREVSHPGIAFLFVTGDGTGRSSLPIAMAVAERGGAIAAVLTRVPNQPLYDGRKEDALIAYTFDQYLKSGDETWPLLLPMVKSAVRAMDTVQAWAQTEHQQKVEKFVVSGASKRGWTTWLSAAADARVCAIAPMVIDMLNMRAQTEWAQKVYGRQSEQIHDYTELGLVEKMDAPPMAKLRGIVDPYSYRARYNIPKLLLLGTNDPYWTVDSLRHYWSDLPGPKLVYQTPNAGHNLGGGREALQTLAAFFQMVADGQEIPSMDWQMNGNGKPGVAVKLNRSPKKALLWTADSNTRDFRQAKWTSRELPFRSEAKEISTEVERPSSGYRAFMAEVVLGSPTGRDYRLSTQVQVTPDNIK